MSTSPTPLPTMPATGSRVSQTQGGTPLPINYPNGEATTYSYDPTGRLTTILSAASSFTYTYDNVGNRLTKTEDDKRSTPNITGIENTVDSVFNSVANRDAVVIQAISFLSLMIPLNFPLKISRGNIIEEKIKPCPE